MGELGSIVTVSEELEVTVEEAPDSLPDFRFSIRLDQHSIDVSDWLELLRAVLSESREPVFLSAPYTRPRGLQCPERDRFQLSIVQVGHYPLRLKDFLAISRRVFTWIDLSNSQDPRRQFLAKLPEMSDRRSQDGERKAFINWALALGGSAGNRAEKPDPGRATQPA